MFSLPLKRFAGIPITNADIRSSFPDLSSPEKKVLSMEKSGELIRLKRNLYIVNPDLFDRGTDPRLCANHIYGPSYVSLQWALRYFGMIPEQVFVMTSVTTKRSHSFQTPIGTFSYVQVPAVYFPIGVESMDADGVSFLMAGREKALCDTILYDNYVPQRSVKALTVYLEDDLRIDMELLRDFNVEVIEECARVGRKTRILSNLIKIINSL